MKKDELLKNLSTVTIPASIVIFAIVFLISKKPYVASAITLLFLSASIYSNIGKYREDKKRERAGFTQYKFRTNKVYEMVTPGDLGPALCFEIENERYLLLVGQWIFDGKMYDDKARPFLDEESNYFNGYKEPYSFPSREFEIWTSNLDGKPVKINILGEYLEPEKINCDVPQNFLDKRFGVIERNQINLSECQPAGPQRRA
jgi:hypothetical protein